MTSSKLSAKASRGAAPMALAVIGNVIRRNVRQGAGPEVGRCFRERPRQATQPRQHIVVDDYDAENRMADHDSGEIEGHVRGREIGVQGHAGQNAWQRDRQHQGEGNRVARARRHAVTAMAASVPSSTARVVATDATCNESTKAARTSSSAEATANQRKLKAAIGQLCTLLAENA